MTEKTGPELMDEVVQHPTIDLYLDRHPKSLTVEDKKRLISMLREERALFIKADMEKRNKK